MQSISFYATCAYCGYPLSGKRWKQFIIDVCNYSLKGSIPFYSRYVLQVRIDPEKQIKPGKGVRIWCVPSLLNLPPSGPDLPSSQPHHCPIQPILPPFHPPPGPFHSLYRFIWSSSSLAIDWHTGGCSSLHASGPAACMHQWRLLCDCRKTLITPATTGDRTGQLVYRNFALRLLPWRVVFL